MAAMQRHLLRAVERKGGKNFDHGLVLQSVSKMADAM
jgi:hypothetical protein